MNLADRIDTSLGSFDTLEDAVADRNVAERAIAAAEHPPSWKVLHDTLLQLESGPGAIGERFDLAIERLAALYHRPEDLP